MIRLAGLVELIALNIGYDLGIRSPGIFVMLVIMAVSTTCLTGPLLGFSEFLRSRNAIALRPVAKH